MFSQVKQRFIVIGLDDHPAPYLPPQVLELIRRGRIFSGGLRHRAIVSHLLPPGAEWIPVTVPIDAVFEQYEATFSRLKEGESIVVFASGDPLFFGLANTIRRKLPEARLQVYPAFNSLQALAHRLGMPYDDMRNVSLTGRPWSALDRALIERAPLIGILTDRQHTPDAIAGRLIDYGYTLYYMYVGECLGHPEREHVRRLSLTEAATTGFDRPNCVLLRAEQADGSPCAPTPRPFGIPDTAFALLDGRARMITKAPIRLLTLQALELSRRHVFWDVGFCTGSVSIEARLQFPHLEVTAFEIRPEGEDLMRTNSRRLGAPGITTLIGDFLLADTAALPRPDAVFIGGHGGRLGEVVERITRVLLPGGCVVFNSVTADSRATFVRAAQAHGLTPEPDTRIALNDYNPITILKARKAPI